MSTSRTMLALAFIATACTEGLKPPANASETEVQVSKTALTSAELPPGAGYEPLVVEASAARDAADACRLKFDDPTLSPTFGFDSSELAAKDMDTLRSIAACLTSGALSGHEIKLVGRTDAAGNEHYNQMLGARRTGSVATFLEQAGVARSRIHETSRGELESIGTDEIEREGDRRVDITLISGLTALRP